MEQSMVRLVLIQEGAPEQVFELNKASIPSVSIFGYGLKTIANVRQQCKEDGSTRNDEQH